MPDILERTPKHFFHERGSFLKHKVDIGYSKVKHIPGLTCYMKPEACTFLWVFYYYYYILTQYLSSPILRCDNLDIEHYYADQAGYIVLC